MVYRDFGFAVAIASLRLDVKGGMTPGRGVEAAR
jgi:hypothetical protein